MSLAQTLAAARRRARLARDRARLIASARGAYAGGRLAFILPVAEAGGGANVILQEARALAAYGASAWLINVEQFRPGFEAAYPALALPVLYGPQPTLAAFVAKAAATHGFDAVIATSASSFKWLPPPAPGVSLLYYLQDAEADFFPPGSPDHAEALATYTARPEIRRVTKSDWNAAALEAAGGLPAKILGPSVDLARFRPGPPRRGPLRVCAMVRPSTPRRNPALTLRVLAALATRFGPAVSLACFGATEAETAALGIPLGGIARLGVLTPDRVAALLRGSDIFLDLSAWQAMGLTGLEAMASGCAVVLPARGGAREFCADGITGLLADTTDEAACLAAAARLIETPSLRRAIARAAPRAAEAHPPERPALALLRAAFPQGAKTLPSPSPPGRGPG